MVISLFTIEGKRLYISLFTIEVKRLSLTFISLILEDDKHQKYQIPLQALSSLYFYLASKTHIKAGPIGNFLLCVY